jgi:prophage tail gpP-like protein
MRIEVNGNEYFNFVSANCSLRLDALSNTFSFEAVAPEDEPLPFKGGESCRIIVSGEVVLTGSIEVVNINYNEDDHTINISGRDKTGDLLDSTLDNIDDLRGEGLTLKAIIEKVISSLGLDLQVIDEVNPEPFNAAEDVSSPEPGDNAFQFIEKYARKRQVLLTSNADGNVVIASNSGIQADGVVQHIIGSEDNNVLNSNFSYDITGRFNAYKMASALNPTPLNLAGDTGLASLVNQGGRVFDETIRKGRQLVLISETPFSDKNCENRAKWEADIRKARGLAYSATVNGFRIANDTGALWRTNRLYQIVDDFVGKIEPMLCNSVSFNFNNTTGSTTDLGFVGQKAYTLFLEEPDTSEVASNVT